MKVEELMQKFLDWAKDDVVEKRLQNSEVGRDWLYKTLEFDEEITLESMQNFFDRNEQNAEYKTRYVEQNVNAKQAYGWLQNEINMIYSFHKCFAMRNQSRLQYYRHDLSQKGARTRSAVNIALGKFLKKRDIAENP